MHPIVVHLGFFTLRSYGLFMALSFALAIAMTMVFNRREGRSDDLVLDLAPWVMLGTVIGARLLYVAVNPGEYAGRPWAVFKVWEGGLVFFGGLAGGVLAAVWWIRRHKHPLWKVCDVIVPGLAMGQALGRVGCFLNGCCYGRMDPGCGVVFPSLEDNLRHLPVQLYEAGFCVALSLFLMWLLPRRRFIGQATWAYVGIYAVGRFLMEFLRGDAERGTLFLALLSPSQWISLAGLGLAIYFYLRLSPRRGDRSLD